MPQSCCIFSRRINQNLFTGDGLFSFRKTCTLETGGCVHTEKARPSMEACGIDVYTTVRRAGLPIEVVKNRRQCPHYYGLLLVD